MHEGSKTKASGSHIILLVASVLYGLSNMVYYGYYIFDELTSYYVSFSNLLVALLFMILSLLFTVFAIVSFAKRNKGNFSHNILSSFLLLSAIRIIESVIGAIL